MLIEPTIEKLKAMRLDAMALTWNEQAGKPDVHKLAFDERFGMLVDAEWLHRENKRLATALREAKLRLSRACIEDIDYPANRELDRAQIRQLATCRWVDEHRNVLITGATGTGKTYVACALAQQACRKGHRAIYRRAARLFSELSLARADGTYARLLAKIARRRHPQHALPEEVNGYFAEMGRVAVELGSSAQEVLITRDPEKAARIREEDDAMDDLQRHLFTVLMDREWKHGVAAAVDVTLLGRFYERFADHAVEVARRVIFQVTGNHPDDEVIPAPR